MDPKLNVVLEAMRQVVRSGTLAALVIGGFGVAEVAGAAETENDRIAAAVQASYAALAAFDVSSVTAAWAHKPYVMRIGPNSKTIAVGVRSSADVRLPEPPWYP